MRGKAYACSQVVNKSAVVYRNALTFYIIDYGILKEKEVIMDITISIFFSSFCSTMCDVRLFMSV